MVPKIQSAGVNCSRDHFRDLCSANDLGKIIDVKNHAPLYCYRFDRFIRRHFVSMVVDFAHTKTDRIDANINGAS